MRQHPTMAGELLRPIHFLHPALANPPYHHEKRDGTGYPHGMKGETTRYPCVFSLSQTFLCPHDQATIQRLLEQGKGGLLRPRAGWYPVWSESGSGLLATN